MNLGMTNKTLVKYFLELTETSLTEKQASEAVELIKVKVKEEFLAELEKAGHIARPFIGASLIDKDIASKYGIKVDLHGGLYVMKLYRGGPAWNAGIRINDIIIKYNGKAIDTLADLRDMINASGIGAAVNVTVLRGEEEMDMSVTLTEIPGQ